MRKRDNNNYNLNYSPSSLNFNFTIIILLLAITLTSSQGRVESSPSSSIRSNNATISYDDDDDDGSEYIITSSTSTISITTENKKDIENKCKLTNNIPPNRTSNCWDFTLPIFLNDITEVTYSQQGCDHYECQELVCACDPYCCGTLWDLSCRGYPDNRFVPGCSAHYLCCESKLFVADVDNVRPQNLVNDDNDHDHTCDCYRERLPTV